jgi:hypothetical protein
MRMSIQTYLFLNPNLCLSTLNKSICKLNKSKINKNHQWLCLTTLLQLALQAAASTREATHSHLSHLAHLTPNLFTQAVPLVSATMVQPLPINNKILTKWVEQCHSTPIKLSTLLLLYPPNNNSWSLKWL